jgi:molybdopterin synthase catalytic subunit
MRLVVRLFAACRERAGTDRLAVDLEVEGRGATLAELSAAIGRACPALAPLLSISRIAVNREFADASTAVQPGDEVALIPPVSGGAGLFALRAEPITTAEVERAVAVPGAGAIVSFAGTVRDRTGEHEVVALDYEAYPEMAESFLRRIGAEVAERWPAAGIAILHRVGRLSVGEISVAIAVSSPHRAAAFEACRHAIERLKQDVPLWKKEIRKNGEIWVGTGS